MTSFNGDKWLKFTIENYDEIKSLLVVWEHSKTRLLDQINTTIVDCIKELENEYFDKANMELKNGSDCYFWYHQDRYTFETDTGLFFEFDPVSDRKIIESNLLGDSFYYYFYVKPEGRTKKDKKSNIDKYKKIFKQNDSELKRKGIVLELQEDEGPEGGMLIAEYHLNKLNIKELKSFETLRPYIKESAKDFTDTINEILTKNNL